MNESDQDLKKSMMFKQQIAFGFMTEVYVIYSYQMRLLIIDHIEKDALKPKTNHVYDVYFTFVVNHLKSTLNHLTFSLAFLFSFFNVIFYITFIFIVTFSKCFMTTFTICDFFNFL